MCPERATRNTQLFLLIAGILATGCSKAPDPAEAALIQEAMAVMQSEWGTTLPNGWKLEFSSEQEVPGLQGLQAWTDHQQSTIWINNQGMEDVLVWPPPPSPPVGPVTPGGSPPPHDPFHPLYLAHLVKHEVDSHILDTDPPVPDKDEDDIWATDEVDQAIAWHCWHLGHQYDDITRFCALISKYYNDLTPEWRTYFCNVYGEMEGNYNTKKARWGSKCGGAGAETPPDLPPCPAC